jgi:hypothetical protein
LKYAFLASLFFIGTIGASTCEETLRESVGVSNECLKQLESIEKRISTNGHYDEAYVSSLKREIERLTFLNKYLLKNLPQHIIDYKMRTADITYLNFNKSTMELLQKNLYRVPVHSLNIRKNHTSKSVITSILQRDDIVSFTEVYHINLRERDIFWLKVGLGWIYVADAKKAEVANMLIEKVDNVGKQPQLPSNISDGKGGVKG